jgi:hypothetical protein
MDSFSFTAVWRADGRVAAAAMAVLHYMQQTEQR